MDIAAICQQQRGFFKSGATKKLEFRIAALCNLQKSLKAHEYEIFNALTKDLGKSEFESYLSELGIVYTELSYLISNAKSFAKPKYLFSPLSQGLADSYTITEPYGNVLIISSWNYPFMLTLSPLIAALAAGNTAIIKPSSAASESAKVLELIIAECFAPEYVAVAVGSREENQELLNQKFDYIFFTGSKTAGKAVLRKAARHITPVTLELGGKSPCIVDATANIPLAARKIVFGKFLNLGQSCVAPDYLLAENSIKDALIAEIGRQITAQFGEQPLSNPNYGKIINKKHFDRLCKLYKKEKVIIGGDNDNDLRIEPTVLTDIKTNAEIMKEEIFGPILPVLGFDSWDEVYEIVEKNPHPLALYLFTASDDKKQEVLGNISFGGGCVNDTIMQLANNKLPFGGVGDSGMGKYRGKAGFDTFSHYKSIVDKLNLFEPDIRYQPYDHKKYKRLRSLWK